LVISALKCVYLVIYLLCKQYRDGKTWCIGSCVFFNDRNPELYDILIVKCKSNSIMSINTYTSTYVLYLPSPLLNNNRVLYSQSAVTNNDRLHKTKQKKSLISLLNKISELRNHNVRETHSRWRCPAIRTSSNQSNMDLLYSYHSGDKYL